MAAAIRLIDLDSEGHEKIVIRHSDVEYQGNDPIMKVGLDSNAILEEDIIKWSKELVVNYFSQPQTLDMMPIWN